MYIQYTMYITLEWCAPHTVPETTMQLVLRAQCQNIEVHQFDPRIWRKPSDVPRPWPACNISMLSLGISLVCTHCYTKYTYNIHNIYSVYCIQNICLSVNLCGIHGIYMVYGMYITSIYILYHIIDLPSPCSCHEPSHLDWAAARALLNIKISFIFTSGTLSSKPSDGGACRRWVPQKTENKRYIQI